MTISTERTVHWSKVNVSRNRFTSECLNKFCRHRQCKAKDVPRPFDHSERIRRDGIDVADIRIGRTILFEHISYPKQK